MFLLLSPALRFILSSTNLRPFNLTILYQRFPANTYCLLESNLLILNEAAFLEVFLTFFLLLGLIVCYISSVASLIIRVVTLDNIIILSFLNHLNFVNTFFTSFSNSSKVWSTVLFTLTGKPSIQRLCWFMSSMVVMVVLMIIFCIERKSVHKRLGSSGNCLSSSQLSCTSYTVGQEKYQSKFCESHCSSPAYKMIA